MAPNVIVHTRDYLTARRGELLAELGAATVAEARERGENGDYSGEQLLLLDELGNVAYLLGDKE